MEHILVASVVLKQNKIEVALGKSLLSDVKVNLKWDLNGLLEILLCFGWGEIDQFFQLKLGLQMSHQNIQAGLLGNPHCYLIESETRFEE